VSMCEIDAWELFSIRVFPHAMNVIGDSGNCTRQSVNRNQFYYHRLIVQSTVLTAQFFVVSRRVVLVETA